jgi:taurine dioxygenase
VVEIRPLSYALGAEIMEADISRPLDDATFAEIYEAFLTHSLLLFRGQALTSEQHVEFARRFGKVDQNKDAVVNKHPRFPEIMKLHYPGSDSADSAASYQGEFWHSDLSFRPNPPSATMLRALVIPPVGGDTMFANMCLAYEQLSDGMRSLIDGLYAVHTGGGNRIDRSTPERLAETMRQNRTAQPIARVHPETGRTSLYIGDHRNVKSLAGMSAVESAPLLGFLMEHATREQFCYRHQWQVDDILIWDNRCLLHRALGDYDRRKERSMERSTLLGTPSGRLYDGPFDADLVGAI